MPGDGDEGSFGGEGVLDRFGRGRDVPAADLAVGGLGGGAAVAAGGAAPEAQQVVLAAQPGVREGLPGALDEVELGLVAAAVGMGLAQAAAVGGLDLVAWCLRAHPEDAVVVWFVHHGSRSVVRGRACARRGGSGVGLDGNGAPNLPPVRPFRCRQVPKFHPVAPGRVTPRPATAPQWRAAAAPAGVVAPHGPAVFPEPART
nr:hypothetical protein GCM10025732_37620 [Glycomyces mayteni]